MSVPLSKFQSDASNCLSKQAYNALLAELLFTLATTQQTCLYGSHMGSATRFRIGSIWVSRDAGCPDGSHMGPI